MAHLFRTPSQAHLTANPTLTLTHFSSAKSLTPCSPVQQGTSQRWGARRMSSPLQLAQRSFQMATVEVTQKVELKNRRRATVQSFQIGQPYADGGVHPALLSPSHRARNSPRICFTYKPPSLHNCKSQTTTGPALLQRSLSSGASLLLPTKRKGEKCRLSSKQFSFSYVPPSSKKIQECRCTLTHSLRAIPVQDDNLNRQDRAGCESKVASTIASSGIPLRESDFSLSASTNRHDSSEISNQAGRTLLECIPSKQLGTTIILPFYSFGGLIEQSSFMRETPQHNIAQIRSSLESCDRQTPFQLQVRQWNNHFLLGGCDLKESIHCGPQLRSQHKFEMLGRYGREIKESTTSLCE